MPSCTSYQRSCMATTLGKTLTFVILVKLTEFLRRVSVQNTIPPFGFLVTVHQMDDLIKTSFSIYAS